MQIFNKNCFLLIFCFILLHSCIKINAATSDESFLKWQHKFKIKATENGISPITIDTAFEKVKLKEHIYKKFDQKQLKNNQKFEEYYNNAINNYRIRNAQSKTKKYANLLKEVEKKYYVPLNYIIALWGIESDFGNNKGEYNVIESLSNLAFDKRRRDFFEKELLTALEILDQKILDNKNFFGSWAGAIGQCQFMPSSYFNFAVDYNQDGITDIWNDKADIFASIANYLNSYNWDYNLPWGYEIKPIRNIKVKPNKIRKLSYYIEKGIEKENGKDFNDYEKNRDSKLLNVGDRYFVTFRNYDILKKWNNSTFFALTIGLFADSI